MGILSQRLRRWFFQTSVLTLFLAGVLLILLISIPKGDSLWARQLRVQAQIQAGTWTTPTETPTATPTITETPTPTLTPTETPFGFGGTSIEVTLTARGFKVGEAESVYGVEGQVCVANGGDFPTENLTILNLIEVKDGTGPFENFLDFDVDTSGKPTLEPGQTHCYTYFKTFTPLEGSKTKYRLTAGVTITNHSGWMPGGNHCPGPETCPFGPNEKADFDLSELLPGAESIFTPTMTPTSTPTITATETATSTSTETCTETYTPTFTFTMTNTPTTTETPEPTLTPTATETEITELDSPTPTQEPSPTETPTEEPSP